MGRSLMDLVDTSEAAKGGTKWRLNDPNKRISDGGKKCGYSDDKTQLEGTVHDGWVFFPLQRDGGVARRAKKALWASARRCRRPPRATASVAVAAVTCRSSWMSSSATRTAASQRLAANC